MDRSGTKPSEISREANPPLQDRRGRVRHKVHTPAYASLNGNSTGMVLDLNEILDISEDGMSIQTSSPLEFKRNLNLCLDLSETKAYIHTSGQVVWSEPSGRSGVRFPEMPDSSLRRLKEWLFLNAITACDHATAQTPSVDAPAKDALAERAEPQREVEPETFATPDYTAILAALTAVEREVESIGPDLDAALRLIVERAQTFTRATGAAIALARGSEMICLASAGSGVPELGARLNASSGFSGVCVRTGSLLRCDDSETDPRVDLESCHALGIRSMIAVPIRLGREVVGLLEVFSSRPSAFSANDGGILERLARIAVIAVSGALHDSAANDNLSDTAPVGVRSQVPTEMLATTTAESTPSRSRHILFYAVAATLVAVSVWLLAPSIQGGIRLWIGRRDDSQPKSKPQIAAAKPPTPIGADASGLAGLRKLAEQGDPTAQFAVGARYATGEDVKQDYSEAVRWFSMAAEQGHIASQATLGAYYWAGRGVSEDLSKAYFWSILAQAGGDQASKYRVAVLTSRLSRAQVIAAQQQANEWLTHHQVGNKNPASSPH